jgi:hypothetical protein
MQVTGYWLKVKDLNTNPACNLKPATFIWVQMEVGLTPGEIRKKRYGFHGFAK